MKKVLTGMIVGLIVIGCAYQAYDSVIYATARAATAPSRLEKRKAELYAYFDATIFRYMSHPDVHASYIDSRQ